MIHTVSLTRHSYSPKAIMETLAHMGYLSKHHKNSDGIDQNPRVRFLSEKPTLVQSRSCHGLQAPDVVSYKLTGSYC